MEELKLFVKKYYFYIAIFGFLLYVGNPTFIFLFFPLAILIELVRNIQKVVGWPSEYQSSLLDKVTYLEEQLAELHAYNGLVSDRKNKLVTAYTKYLIDKEKLPEKVAEAKAKFILLKFKNWPIISELYDKTYEKLTEAEGKYEFEFTNTNQFKKELSEVKIDPEEIILNLEKFWNKDNFKSLANTNGNDNLILEESFLFSGPEHYGEYLHLKAVISTLEKLGILKKVKSSELRTRDGNYTYIKNAEYKFTFLDFDRIMKLASKEKSNTSSKKLNLERNFELLKIEAKQNYTGPYYWRWHYSEYKD